MQQGSLADDAAALTRAAACRAGTNDPNAGVGYYNASAMALIFDDMVRYAIIKDFKFSALDNTLMVGAWNDGHACVLLQALSACASHAQVEFAGSKFTALPYSFNWRPYCAPLRGSCYSSPVPCRCQSWRKLYLKGLSPTNLYLHT